MKSSGQLVSELSLIGNEGNTPKKTSGVMDFSRVSEGSQGSVPKSDTQGVFLKLFMCPEMKCQFIEIINVYLMHTTLHSFSEGVCEV